MSGALKPSVMGARAVAHRVHGTPQSTHSCSESDQDQRGVTSSTPASRHARPHEASRVFILQAPSPCGITQPPQPARSPVSLPAWASTIQPHPRFSRIPDSAASVARLGRNTKVLRGRWEPRGRVPLHDPCPRHLRRRNRTPGSSGGEGEFPLHTPRVTDCDYGS